MAPSEESMHLSRACGHRRSDIDIDNNNTNVVIIIHALEQRPWP